MASAIDLLDEAIADLEAKLNLPPGGTLPPKNSSGESAPDVGAAGSDGKAKESRPKNEGGGGKKQSKEKKDKTKEGQKQQKRQGNPKNALPNLDQPDICKLQFKVGIISKVWVHPDADKLYCEEIDCGEAEPRRIASGLRLHYDEAGMEGRRLLVVSNLKPKNLLGFKSHGMVLCASEAKEDGSERVEFVEPPEGAPLGEIVTFEGLPNPEPLSAAQVEKKKIFAACMGGMSTTDDCVAAWDGHAFMTSAGPCKSRTIKGGSLR